MTSDLPMVRLLREALDANLAILNQLLVLAGISRTHSLHRLAQVCDIESAAKVHQSDLLGALLGCRDGTPHSSELFPSVPQSAPLEWRQQLAATLAASLDLAERYRSGIAEARRSSDEEAASVLTMLLAAEERIIDTLEAELNGIREMGVDSYIAGQQS